LYVFYFLDIQHVEVSTDSFLPRNICFVYFLFTYYRSGRIATIRIQDENDSDGIRTLNNVKLTLTNSRTRPKLIITIPPDEEVLIFYNQIHIL
jgi:hypothetical protein